MPFHKMINVSNLSKLYYSGKESIKALDDISIAFPECGMVFLLGKSGCGKSTLLNIIGGLDKPTAGQLLVDGRDTTCFSSRDLDNYRGSTVGFVFQNINLIPDLNVADNVSLSLELLGEKCDSSSVETALDRVGLHGLSKRNTNELSGGQRQRVAIARALIKNPAIVIADEPTGSLDSETGRGIFELLKELSKDRLVIVASHDRDSAEKFADRIIELKDGKIVRDLVVSDDTGSKKACNKTNVKPALPRKVSAKSALSALKKKRFKLVMSMLLAGLSFSMLGALISASTVDEGAAIFDGLRHSYLPSVEVIKRIEGVKEKNVYFDTYGDNWYEYDAGDQTFEYGLFSQTELESLNAKGADSAGVFLLPDNFDVSFEDRLAVEEPLNVYYTSGGGYLFEGFSDCGSSFCSDHFTLKAGRYPEAVNEIAISSYKADMFTHLVNEGGERAFSSLDEIIGGSIKLNSELEGKLGEVTITGIYDTNEVPAKFESLKSFPGYNDTTLCQEFYSFKHNTFLDVAFVSESFYDTYIGKYDRDRKSLGSLALEARSLFYTAISDSKLEKPSIGSEYIISKTIPSAFVNERIKDFTVLDLDGNPLKDVRLNDDEVLVSEDFKNFALGGKYRALLDDISYLKPGILKTISPLCYSADAYNLFNSEEFERKTSSIETAGSRGLDSEQSEAFLTDYQDIEESVAHWYPELLQRSYVLDALRRYGYYSNGNARNQYADKLFRRYLDGAEMSEFQSLSTEITQCLSLEDYLSIPENDWARLMGLAEKFYKQVIGATRSLEKYCTLMPMLSAEDNLSTSPNKEAALAIAKQFNDRFNGNYDSLSEAFLAGELSDEDYQNLANTFILTSTSEEEKGLYELGHYKERKAYETSIDIMSDDGVTVFKSVGSISCYGDRLKGTIVANPATLKKLGLKIDKHSSLSIETSGYSYSGDGKYSKLVSSSISTRNAFDLLNESHGTYRYMTADPVSSDVRIQINSLVYTQTIFGVGSILLAIFSALLLMSFINGSVRDKEREIGILRAMGASTSDVFKTFLIESSFIGVMSAVIGNVISWVFVLLMNLSARGQSIYDGDLYRFGFPVVAILFGVALLISFLASLKPIITICKKDAVEAIRCDE